jgi:hypothetical protein
MANFFISPLAFCLLSSAAALSVTASAVCGKLLSRLKKYAFQTACAGAGA